MMIVVNPAWFLVIASGIAVVGILIAFRQLVSNLLFSESGSDEELQSRLKQEVHALRDQIGTY